MTRLASAAVLALCLAGCAQIARRPTAQNAPPPAAARILLTVAEQGDALPLTGAPERRYLRRRAYGPTPAVDRILDALARDHELRRIDGWPIRSLHVYCEVFEVPDAAAIDALLAELMTDQRVELAQRMNTFETLTSEHDDTYADLQPAAAQLDLAEAHKVATGKGVLVAVIDSAVDAAHPDLAGRVRVQRDLVERRAAPRHGEVHGTAVAGVIGSLMDNHEGIVGVAPEVDIAALRACWPVAEHASGAVCSSFSLAQALEVAIEIHAAVINLSLAGPRDPLLESLLDVALERGALIVAAEPGPEGAQYGFPASHARVIVARSSAETPRAAAPYQLQAPAKEILTTVPDSGYAFLSGTSLAAAHVSGVIALLIERRPRLAVDDVVSLLRATTVRSKGQASVNACRALEKLMLLQRLCGFDGAVVSARGKAAAVADGGRARQAQ